MKNRTKCKTNATWQSRWIVLFSLFAIHCSLFVSFAGAQTFTQRIQQTVKGEGTVTIHQSKEIDDLVNAPVSPTKKTEAAPQQKQQEKQEKQEKQQEKQTDKSAAQNSNTTPANTASSAPEKDTLEVAQTIPHRTRKVMGYRVQAFAGGNTRSDRQKAEQTANAIRTLFPTEAVYTHFYNPRWICRVGNYPTYEEARRMLKELRSLGYSSATIVKGKITVPY